MEGFMKNPRMLISKKDAAAAIAFGMALLAAVIMVAWRWMLQ